MIDIKFFKRKSRGGQGEHPQKIPGIKALSPLVDEVSALDAESRKAKRRRNDLRASGTRISKEESVH